MSFALFSRIYANAPLLLCLATFGWGTNAVASRLAIGEVSPMMLIFFAMGSSCFDRLYAARQRDDQGMASHS